MAEYDKTRDSVKIRARRALQRRVALGLIVRQPCSDCGAESAHAHHKDYAKPYDVDWLCPRCHAALHRELHGTRGVEK